MLNISYSGMDIDKYFDYLEVFLYVSQISMVPFVDKTTWEPLVT